MVLIFVFLLAYRACKSEFFKGLLDQSIQSFFDFSYVLATQGTGVVAEVALAGAAERALAGAALEGVPADHEADGALEV
jgi:hypothetical protein